MLFSKRTASAGTLLGRAAKQQCRYYRSLRQQLKQVEGAKLITSLTLRSASFLYYLREGQLVRIKQSYSGQAIGKNSAPFFSLSTERSSIRLDSQLRKAPFFLELKLISVIQHWKGDESLRSNSFCLGGASQRADFLGTSRPFFSVEDIIKFLCVDQIDPSSIGQTCGLSEESSLLTRLQPQMYELNIILLRELKFCSWSHSWLNTILSDSFLSSLPNSLILSSARVEIETQYSSYLGLGPSVSSLIQLLRQEMVSQSWQSLLMEQRPPLAMYLSKVMAWVISLSLATELRFQPAQTQIQRWRWSLRNLLSDSMMI